MPYVLFEDGSPPNIPPEDFPNPPKIEDSGGLPKGLEVFAYLLLNIFVAFDLLANYLKI